MTDHTVAIAPIPLARSTRRLVGVPLLLLAAGAASVAGGATLGGLVGIGLVAAGIVVAALSVYLALRLLTLRLDVEVATLRLRWLWGERRYTLVRGPVTRVALLGDEAASLRPRFGALGWAVGRARLRREEEIEVVRLAPTATMILVPTDRGRLGIAPASEEHLLSALSAAARIQQRLDEVAERARTYLVPPPVPAAAPIVEEPAAAAAAPAGRRMLTGIERQLLEERLAADRAATLERAEAERRAAMEAAAAGAVVAPAPEAAAGSAAVAREGRLRRWLRPARLGGRRRAQPPALDVEAMPDVRAAPSAPLLAATAAPAVWPRATPVPAPERPAQVAVPTVSEPVFAPEPVRALEPVPAIEPTPAPEPVPAPAPAATPAAAAQREAVSAPRPRVRADVQLAFVLALTPVIGAGAIWFIAWTRGDLAMPIAELRPIALALLAIGPAGALAALAARAWYPRLQGLVTITALVALVLVGRVLLG